MRAQLADVIRKLNENPAAFVAECEAQYAAQVDAAAKQIIYNLDHNHIVLLSGPSGSSKTTTSKRIAAALGRLCVTAHIVSMDNYYKTIDPDASPRTPEGEIDYESPYCLDTELLNHHFDVLEEGGEILIPHFNFSVQRREEGRVTPMRLGKNDVAIFEGIHALNPIFTEKHPNALKVYVSPEAVLCDGGSDAVTGADLRLVRRLIRDDFFRGADPAFTLGMWDNIQRGEVINILPYKPSADIAIDTALLYEPAVLRQFTGHLLGRVPETAKNFHLLRHALRAFPSFPEADLGLVPKNSILREFIGGSAFEY
jgi:uridine kinase